MMVPGQDITSKEFFKRRWHRPFSRFLKIIMPIVLASLLSYFILLNLFVLSVWLFGKHINHLTMFVQVSSSVLFGLFFTLIAHQLKKYRQSRFLLIILKSLQKRGHDESHKDTA